MELLKTKKNNQEGTLLSSKFKPNTTLQKYKENFDVIETGSNLDYINKTLLF